MVRSLQSDASRAIAFVSWLNPEAVIYLEQMSSKGKASPRAKTYAQENKSGAVSFVETNNSNEFQRTLNFFRAREVKQI